MTEWTWRTWPAETEAALRRLGWYPGRAVSTTRWAETLRSYGYPEIFPLARRFLTEFGGLVLTQRRPDGLVRIPIRLNPMAANRDLEIFQVMSEDCGVPLYPVGDVDSTNFCLGIAPDGAVYLGKDDVVRYADDPEEAVRRLMRRYGPSGDDAAVRNVPPDETPAAEPPAEKLAIPPCRMRSEPSSKSSAV